MKNKLWLRILIPVLIAAVIGGMWIIKNKSAGRSNAPSQDRIASDSTGDAELPDPLKDADFSLCATEAIDFKALSSYGLPVVVDYGADACVPCQRMAPVLEKANKEFYGKAFVKFINVWEYPDAVDNVPVQLIPAQVLFNADGTPFVPGDELAAEIPFNLYSSKETGEHAITMHQGGLTEEQMWKILKEMGVE